MNNEPHPAEISYDKDTIELNEPLSQNQTLIADFMFDVIVRFSNDSFEYNMTSDGTI